MSHVPSGHRLIVHTPRVGGHRFVWKTVERRSGFYTFQVRACAEARIALGPEPGVLGGHEVALGSSGNTRACVLWRDAAQRCSVVTSHMLDCHRRRAFWLSWAGDVIRVGAGDTRGRGLLVEWAVPGLDTISALSFTTADDNQGYWTFDEDLGAFANNINPTYNYSRSCNKTISRVTECYHWRLKLKICRLFHANMCKFDAEIKSYKDGKTI